MDRARSRRRSTHNRPFQLFEGRASRLPALLDAALVLISLFLLPGRASAGDVAIVPSAEGRLGAWLVLGPVPATAKGNRAPRNLDSAALAGGAEESNLTARLGRSVPIALPEGTDPDAPTTATWRVISSGSGPIDVAQALNHRGGEAFAFLYGVLHLSEPLRGFLLLGSSDGARVWIDRKVVSSTDGSRPERDDEDVVRLDLPAGDHGILIKLHHRDAWWAVRVRVVDAAFAAPRGVFRLTGTGDAEFRSLAQRMTDIGIDRGLCERGFRPTVGVSFPEGMLRGVDRTVRVSASAHGSGKIKRLFAFEAGEVPLGETGPSELKVHLPTIGQDEISDDLNGGELVISVEAGGRKLDAPLQLRPFMLNAAASATRAISLLSGSNGFLADAAVARATIEHARDRFAKRVGGGDTDLEALSGRSADSRRVCGRRRRRGEILCERTPASGASPTDRRSMVSSRLSVCTYRSRSPMEEREQEVPSGRRPPRLERQADLDAALVFRS